VLTGAGGWLLVLPLALPAAAVLLAVALGGRHVERVVLVSLPVGLIIAAMILASVWRSDEALTYFLGNWAPPLGVALRADGLSAAMLVMTALVICATGLFVRADRGAPRELPEARAPTVFWILLLALWGAMNAVFLGEDLFHLYVALELLTFAAVPLVCLDGRAETMAAALRYLLIALAGSILYLLGVALLYGAYGTLDIGLLSARVRGDPATWAAAALMTAGLSAKTALFPLHVWLPPAHAGAPPAASAVLSALVVKASFFLIVRLWFDVMPGLMTPIAGQLLAGLGAGAILVGGVSALRQVRLKLLIAYSTVAQIGYLFLVFPLAGYGSTVAWSAIAWTGGILQLMSHAFAKAAMFMAAGLIGATLGHDRIDGLRGIGRALPMTVIAFALGGLSLMGVPWSGGFIAKWLLLRASIESGQWWWALAILGGGLLAGGYVFRVLAPALGGAEVPVTRSAAVPRRREAIVLALALLSVLLGLVPLGKLGVLQIGRPHLAEASLP
jgi:formate hydrogenlyase subunit 3/multisubunit Na+/H+ antiporter MnhD subunit